MLDLDNIYVDNLKWFCQFFFFVPDRLKMAPIWKRGKNLKKPKIFVSYFLLTSICEIMNLDKKNSAQPVLLLGVLIIIDIIYHSRLWYLGKYILLFLVSIIPSVNVGRKNEMRCLGLSKPDAVTKVILSKLSLWNMKKKFQFDVCNSKCHSYP